MCARHCPDCRQNHLFAKKSKCELFMHEIEFLGHHVGRDGLRVMADKVKSVQDWPTPRNASEVRSFLGLAGYYRRFIQGFSRIAVPLHDLTHTADGKSYEWLPLHQQAFDELKSALREAPVLALPDPDRQFVVNTDASDFATGAVLQQDFGHGLQPIAFSSHKLYRRGATLPDTRSGDARDHQHAGRMAHLPAGPPAVRHPHPHGSQLAAVLHDAAVAVRPAVPLARQAVRLRLQDRVRQRAIECRRGRTLAPRGLRPSDRAPWRPDARLARRPQGSATLPRQSCARTPACSRPLAPTLSAPPPRAASRSASPDAPAERAARGQTAVPRKTRFHPAADRPAPDRQGVIGMPSQQCTALHKRGTACKRRTLRGHHCRDHMRLLQRLAIGKSTIAGAGDGVCSAKYKGAKPIAARRRSCSTRATGCRSAPAATTAAAVLPRDHAQARRRRCSHQHRARPLGQRPTRRQGCSGSPLRPTHSSSSDRQHGRAKPSRTIQPGDEILVSYGRDYWRFHAGGAGVNDQARKHARIGQPRKRLEHAVAGNACVAASLYAPRTELLLVGLIAQPLGRCRVQTALAAPDSLALRPAKACCTTASAGGAQ